LTIADFLAVVLGVDLVVVFFKALIGVFELFLAVTLFAGLTIAFLTLIPENIFTLA